MKKTLSNLSEGDKVFIYSFNGEVSEIEVKSVGHINECGYFPVFFKGTTLYDIRFYKDTGYFWLSEHWIYSTLDGLERIFKKIYEAGEKYMRYQIRNVLGLEE